MLVDRKTVALAVAVVVGLTACGGGSKSETPPPSTPAVSLSSGSLNFTATAAGANPASQAVTVTNSGSGTLAVPTTSIAYASGSGWLTASVSGTSAPFTVTVQAATGALAVGTWAATVSVASAGASNSPQSFSVSFTVNAAPAPAISLSTGSLNFTATAAGANPASQAITVSNSGVGTLAVPTTSIAYASGSGWLTASVSGTSAPFTVTVQPATGALAVGTYAATVSVTSAGASNTPQSFSVSFTVTAAPAISLSAASLDFTATAGGSNPASQAVTVSNSGSGTLSTPTASIAYASGSGWLTASVSGSTAPFTVTVQPATGALPIGTYTATVSVTSAGASNSPRSFSVSFTVDQTWTVFVYGHGDHNLSESLITDMVEMTAATLSSSVNVVVAADFSAGRTMADGVTSFPTGTTWYRIPGGGADPIELGTIAEQNFDDPAVLQGSIEAAFTSYPADRYGLILWDHGGSWQGGFGGDENDVPGTSAGGMSAQQVATAVRAALDASGLTGSRPLEFLAFDTCLMAGNEVAYEMRDLARVYLADAEIDFGDGWDYTATLTQLNANRGETAQEFALAEVAAWDAQHLAAGNDDQQLRSHIAIDMALYDAYVTAFADLTWWITNSVSIDPYEIGRAQYDALPGYGGTFTDPSASPDLRDAGQILGFLSYVASDADVAAAAGDTWLALDAMTIDVSNGDLRVANAQSGFHMESPLVTSWGARRTDYVTLGWDAATGWSFVLDGMASFADATPPTVVTAIINDYDPDTLNPPTLTISSADADVAEARVYLAENIAGTAYMYGVVGAGPVLPGIDYEFIWDGTMLGLSDGVDLSEITVLPWVSGASPIFIAPGELSSDGDAVTAYAVLDSSTTAVTTIFIEVEGRVSALGVSSLRGAAFTPFLWNLTSGTFEYATPLTIPDVVGASLTLSWEQAAPGDYLLATEMSDVWGNTAAAIDPVTVLTPF